MYKRQDQYLAVLLDAHLLKEHVHDDECYDEMCIRDSIKRVQEVIARESRQLVYAHYNLTVSVTSDTDIQKWTNHLENCFSRLGIHKMCIRDSSSTDRYKWAIPVSQTSTGTLHIRSYNVTEKL